MSELIYCAMPSRLIHRMKDVMDFVTNQGYAPLHPFQALPYERFEGNHKVGRIKAMEYCLRLVDISDEFWMFGVSNGTLEEVVHAIKIGKPIKLLFDNFDPEWKKFYDELGKKYGNPINHILDFKKKSVERFKSQFYFYSFMCLSKIGRENLIESMAGIWKNKITETGTEYTKNIRKGWKTRLKKAQLL